MNKNIAFFDFDGTVTTKDTMLVFLNFFTGRYRFMLNMLLLTPVFISLKLGMVSNHRAKELMLKRFIGGVREADLVASCKKFATDILPQLIRPQALDAILKHKINGAEIVVVSASPEYWVRDWCEANGLLVIATVLDVENGYITGNIRGLNCYGQEKVDRILQRFSLNNYEAVYAYGDTPGDKPMLSLAHHAFYKPFRGL